MFKKEKSSNLLVFDSLYLPKVLFIFFVISLTMMLMLTPLGSTEIGQQINAKSSIGNSPVIKSFIAHGDISSVVYTVYGNWDVHGIWAVIVANGKVTAFNANMNFANGTASHSHEFQNFIAKNNNAGLDTDQSLSFDGKMDVGTNGIISWYNVPSQINIEKGKTITISVDDKQTDDHFGGQSIHGTINVIKPCGLKPGPQMQIPTTNC
jgi:hypothetical protein